ncbi:peptidase C39, partial [Neisseria meningitidis]
MKQKRRFTASLLLAAALPLYAHSFPFAEENPIAYGKVKIQSWKARRDFNIVKQDLD